MIKKTTVTFAMPTALKNKAQKEAKKMQIPMAMWFRLAVQEKLENGKR